MPSACAPFLAAGERPQIVAQENCLRRFRRYALTHGWNARINQRQFSLPEPIFPHHFDWPTLTFRDALTQRLGDLDVHVRAAKGETDDACWVWIPERGYLFTGDLVIWQAPNCGNPQKVQRYPAEWAEALEAWPALDAEWLFPGHGLVVQGPRRGAQRAHRDGALSARHHRPGADAHERRPDAGGDLPRRRARCRAGDAAVSAGQLRPSQVHRAQPAAPVGRMVERQRRRPPAGDDGGAGRARSPRSPAASRELVARGRALLDAGEAVLAAHLAEWATRAEPGDRAAQS